MYKRGKLSFFDFKAVWTLKNMKSDFFAEYPIWVSIKSTLTGKLEVDGQNLIYCVQF